MQGVFRNNMSTIAVCNHDPIVADIGAGLSLPFHWLSHLKSDTADGAASTSPKQTGPVVQTRRASLNVHMAFIKRFSRLSEPGYRDTITAV